MFGNWTVIVVDSSLELFRESFDRRKTPHIGSGFDRIITHIGTEAEMTKKYDEYVTYVGNATLIELRDNMYRVVARTDRIADALAAIPRSKARGKFELTDADLIRVGNIALGFHEIDLDKISRQDVHNP